jgi:hypothetical protein
MSFFDKLLVKAFWTLRGALRRARDLVTPAPFEGEFCGAYRDRVNNGDAGPHGTVVGIDVVVPEAVWRGGRWTSRHGDEDAYYNANPHKVRPVLVAPNEKGSS